MSVNSPQSINIAFVNTSSVPFLTPVQQVTITDFTNRSYIRQMFATQNGVKMVAQGQVVQIPLNQLFLAAASYNPAMTWAPIITAQPTSSAQFPPCTQSFVVVATAETAITYQWSSGSSSSGPWGVLTDNIFLGNAISGSMTSVLTLKASDTISLYKFYECVVSNTSGGSTSSVAQFTLV